MSAPTGSLASSLVRFLIQHPIQTILYAIVSVALTTRVYTGLRLRSMLRKQRTSDGVHEIPIMPYWIPWLGQALQFGLGGGKYLRSIKDKLGANSSMFTLIMANEKHHMVMSPSIATQILFDRRSPISMEPFIYRTMEKFWDDGGVIRTMDRDVIFGVVHATLSDMMRQSFVDSAIPVLSNLLKERLGSLVSDNADPLHHTPWEQDGSAKIVQAATATRPYVVEADMFRLLRNFVGYIASDALMGKTFLKNYPGSMNDLWKADERVILFMLNAPKWLPGMGQAIQARERLVNSIADHHAALGKVMNGEAPDSRWGDMSDVSTVMIDRTREWLACNATSRVTGCGDAAVFWAMHVNSNPLAFWVIWYVFSDAALLAEVREELSPYVTKAPGQEVKIDLDALWKHCPLLKGAFFETMRIEAAAMSYKIAEEDFIVSESAEDAKLLGKDEPESFLIKKGEYICIAHNVHQSDDQYFRDPQQFNARRFWTHDADGKFKDVEYKTMKVWGGGKQMCKGRTFAEREVMMFAAAIISAWEMQPVDGKWVYPGQILTAGTTRPKANVKVRMWKREGWWN